MRPARMDEHKKRKIELIVGGVSLVAFLVALAVQLTATRYAEKLPLVTNLPFFLFLNFNIFLLALVVFLFVRNITKLGIEQRRGPLGSSLVKKMLFVSLVTSLLPALCLFIPSIFIVIQVINGWFGSQVQSTFQGVKALQDELLDARYKEINGVLEVLLSEERALTPQALEKQLERVLGGGVRVERLAGAVRDGAFPVPQERVSRDEPEWVWVEPPWVVRFRVPDAWKEGKGQLEQLQAAYQKADVLKSPIKALYILLFTNIFFCVLFVATWGAFKFANALLVPLRRLSEVIASVRIGKYENALDVEGNGEFSALVEAFNQMVGELKKVQDELWEKNRYLEGLLNHITAAVIGIDLKGKLISINEPAKAFLKNGDSAYVGMAYWRALEAWFVLKGHELFRRMNHAQGSSLTSPLEVKDVRGNKRYLVWFLSAIRPKDRSEGGLFLVVVEDQTELVLAQKTQVWQQAARHVAHEIKNPLTPIRLSADRLSKALKPRTTKEREVLKECTGIIVREVGELTLLVDNFSAYARLPSLRLAMTDVNELLTGLVQSYRTVFPDVLWKLELDPHVPNSSLDPDYVRRALVNLIKNGLEAMEEAAASSKILRLRSRYVPSGGISLFVEDSGKGIPKEALPVLGDLSFSTKAQGSGIGLGLVRGIVEAHGGEIRLHANDWGGATIEVYLPTKKPSSGT